MHNAWPTPPPIQTSIKMSNLKTVSDDKDFEGRLVSALDELVVVDFYTTWCGPCKKMEGTVTSLAMKYPSVLFLKVDADQCFETAMKHNLKGVPLFVLYRNMRILDQIQGAQPQVLDSMIQSAESEYRHRGASHSSGELPSYFVKQASSPIPDVGQVVEVSKFLDMPGCRVINDLAPSSFDAFLSGKKLISGKGSGKLLLVYSFNEKLILHSFIIKAKPDSGPKVLRFFVNHPKVLDFQVAAQIAPSQEVTLCPDDLSGERPIEFRAGGFNLVTNLQIFVADVMSTTWKPSGYHRVELESLKLYGAPVIIKDQDRPPTTSPVSLIHQHDQHAQVGVVAATSTSTSDGNRGLLSPGEIEVDDPQNHHYSFVEEIACGANEPECPLRKSGPYAGPPRHPRENAMFTGNIRSPSGYPDPPIASQPGHLPIGVGVMGIQEIIAENLKSLQIETAEEQSDAPIFTRRNNNKKTSEQFVDALIAEDIRSFILEQRKLQAAVIDESQSRSGTGIRQGQGLGHDPAVGHQVESNNMGKSKPRISKAKSNNANANTNAFHDDMNDLPAPPNKGTVASINKQTRKIKDKNIKDQNEMDSPGVGATKPVKPKQGKQKAKKPK